MNSTTGLLRVSRWLFVANGIWLIALGGYFMLMRPALLPEDLRYLGSSAIQVQTLLPQLAPWLRNVFTVMGGFMAGCGVLVIFVGVRAAPQYALATAAALGCAGLLSVTTMSWTNFALDSDFKWLLLAPVFVWTLGLVSYVVGSSATSSRAATTPPNHPDLST